MRKHFKSFKTSVFFQERVKKQCLLNQSCVVIFQVVSSWFTIFCGQVFARREVEVCMISKFCLDFPAVASFLIAQALYAITFSVLDTGVMYLCLGFDSQTLNGCLWLF